MQGASLLFPSSLQPHLLLCACSYLISSRTWTNSPWGRHTPEVPISTSCCSTCPPLCTDLGRTLRSKRQWPSMLTHPFLLGAEKKFHGDLPAALGSGPHRWLPCGLEPICSECCYVQPGVPRVISCHLPWHHWYAVSPGPSVNHIRVTRIISQEAESGCQKGFAWIDKGMRWKNKFSHIHPHICIVDFQPFEYNWLPLSALHIFNTVVIASYLLDQFNCFLNQPTNSKLSPLMLHIPKFAKLIL